MIPTLSNIYTQTLGPWSLGLFYTGAIIILYGTIFASTAAHSRLYADMARLMRFFPAEDFRKRLRLQNGLVVMLTVVPVIFFLLFKSPVKMVVAGGLAQALMLPVIAMGALYLRHRHLPPELAPGRLSTLVLWIAASVITLLMGYYAVLMLQKLL